MKDMISSVTSRILCFHLSNSWFLLRLPRFLGLIVSRLVMFLSVSFRSYYHYPLRVANEVREERSEPERINDERKEPYDIRTFYLLPYHFLVLLSRSSFVCRMLPSFLHYVRLSYSEERSERLTERDEPSMLTTEGGNDMMTVNGLSHSRPFSPPFLPRSGPPGQGTADERDV